MKGEARPCQYSSILSYYCYDKNSESCKKSSYLRDINLEILDFTVNTRILSQVAVMISVGRENHEMRGGGVLLSVLTGMVSGITMECSQEMRMEGEVLRGMENHL